MKPSPPKKPAPSRLGPCTKQITEFDGQVCCSYGRLRLSETTGVAGRSLSRAKPRDQDFAIEKRSKMRCNWAAKREVISCMVLSKCDTDLCALGSTEEGVFLAQKCASVSDHINRDDLPRVRGGERDSFFSRAAVGEMRHKNRFTFS